MFPYKNSFLSVLLLGTFVACTTPQSKVVECAYMPKVEDNTSSDFSPQGECGKLIDEDSLLLYPEHFNNLNFATSSFASVYTNSGMFYVSKSGKVMKTMFFDNGADYFEEGLARTISKGKYGFMNRKLDVVIEPQFDFVFPFSKGKAKFCNGCKEKKDKHGEHSMRVGGTWGFVDKEGKITFE